jgi:DNA-binding MarR family transcriptional regulator
MDLRVHGRLEIVRISQLCEWNVLTFLHRHGTSLASAEQIALLLGYSRSAIGEALDHLVTLRLVHRSRSSQGVSLYRLVTPLDSAFQQGIEEVLKLLEKRSGRLPVARSLRERAQPMLSAPI